MTLELNLRTMAMAVAMQMRTSSADFAEADRLERQLTDITRHHGALIAKLCFYYSDSKEDFDDLRQDCLINIWRGLRTFDGRASLTTWLYRVCLNTCVSFIRKTSARPENVSLELVHEVAGDEDADRQEQLRILYAMISQLPLVDRAIVMMWLDGCSHDKIAEVNGLKRNAVAVRLHRIKQKLAKTYDYEN